MGAKQVLAAVCVAEAGGLDTMMDSRFGRAPVFLIVDTATREIADSVENGSVNAAHGAGTGAAALMAKHQVEKVVAGRFGPKAYEALLRLGIEMWIAPSGITAADAVEKLEAGQLERMKVKVY